MYRWDLSFRTLINLSAYPVSTPPQTRKLVISFRCSDRNKGRERRWLGKIQSVRKHGIEGPLISLVKRLGNFKIDSCKTSPVRRRKRASPSSSHEFFSDRFQPSHLFLLAGMFPCGLLVLHQWNCQSIQEGMLLLYTVGHRFILFAALLLH